MEKQVEEQRRFEIERLAKLEQQKDKEKQSTLRQHYVRQKQENENLKEQARQQQQAEAKGLGDNDLFQQLFAEKRNISFEKALITDKKVELIKD